MRPVLLEKRFVGDQLSLAVADGIRRDLVDITFQELAELQEFISQKSRLTREVDELAQRSKTAGNARLQAS